MAGSIISSGPRGNRLYDFAVTQFGDTGGIEAEPIVKHAFSINALVTAEMIDFAGGEGEAWNDRGDNHFAKLGVGNFQQILTRLIVWVGEDVGDGVDRAAWNFGIEADAHQIVASMA